MADVSTGNTFPTLIDVAKRLDPDGSVPPIAEVLTTYNPILEDMAWAEGNLPTGHRYTSRTALPSLTWRRFNQGIDPSKSLTDQYDETCGMLEGMSKIDCDLAKLNGNEAAFRYSEDRAFLQAFNKEMAVQLFYGDVRTKPEAISGLAPRLNMLPATSTLPSKNQVVACAAAGTGAANTGACSSIWLIGWSPETVFGIFPKGSSAGLQTEDLGKILVNDNQTTAKQFLAYVTRWQWKFGLCVRDYRYVVRGVNIASKAATYPQIGTDAGLVWLLYDLIAQLQDTNTVRPIFYMNRHIFGVLNKQLVSKQANYLEWIDRGGRRIPSFLGIPIVICDAILNTEALVA